MSSTDLAAKNTSRYGHRDRIVILIALFLIQRFGTAMVGMAFGPIMAIYFITLNG